MAKQLLGIAESAESETVKLAAVKDALDRAGLSAKTAVEVTAQLKPYEEAFQAATISPMSRAEHEAAKAERGLPARVEPRTDDTFRARPGRTYDHEMEVVDAELVPEAEEHAAPHASSTGAARDGGDRADAALRRPAWAKDDVARRPGRELMTLEQANAEVAAANRAAGVWSTQKRGRR